MSLSSRLSDEAITILANWWFDIFLGPSHDMGARGKDEVMVNAMASALGGLIAKRHPVVEAQRPCFVDALIQAVREELEDAHSFWALGLGTDYHPARTLYTAMTAVGIDGSRCTWKTSVGVREDGIWIEPGYGAAFELLCDLDGNEPTERWVLHTKWEGVGYNRWSVEYDYTEAKHLDGVARVNARDDVPQFEAWHEQRVDSQWEKSP